MDLSCRHILDASSTPTNGWRAAARISAAEGLAFLTTSALVIATLVVMVTGAQRQFDTDYRAAAAELRRSADKVASFFEASGTPAVASLHREENQAVPGTTMTPILADRER